MDHIPPVPAREMAMLRSVCNLQKADQHQSLQVTDWRPKHHHSLSLSRDRAAKRENMRGGYLLRQNEAGIIS